MKTAYLNCFSGISGDMFLGALVDLGVPFELFHDAVSSLKIDGLHLQSEYVHRCGIRAMKIHVHTPHEHAHRHLSDIFVIIEQAAVTKRAKLFAKNVFQKIAEAEAHVHGITVEHVHFHEIGAADSIADILCAAVGMDYLNFEAIYASPVPTGCGTVKIAHGRCPVPAPATAQLLCGVPLQESDVLFELTTPTGAAILQTFVDKYGPMPSMSVSKIGCGAGDSDFESQPNILQIFVGEIPELKVGKPATTGAYGAGRAAVHTDFGIWTLQTNIDDATPEQIGYCIERLWDAGPLDVFTTPIMMKKQRLATQLSVLCRLEQIETIEYIIFTETRTLGIRRWETQRTVLERENTSIQTEYGEMQAKQITLPNGTQRVLPEYDSAAKIAKENCVPIRDVYF